MTESADGRARDSVVVQSVRERRPAGGGSWATLIALTLSLTTSAGPGSSGSTSHSAAWLLVRAVVGGSARLTPARTLDIAGTGLSAAALLALLLALSRGNDAGWATPSTVALYAAAAAGLLLFVWHETRTPEPLLDPAWFRDRSFAGANLQIRRRNRSSPSSALV